MKGNSDIGTSKLVMYFLVAVFVILALVAFLSILGNNPCVKEDPFKCFQGTSVAELAAQCVMARCYYGCDSDEVKNIKDDASDFRCSNYCNPEIINFIGSDRICGFQFPIIVQLDNKDSWIEKSNLGENYQCIETSTAGALDYLALSNMFKGLLQPNTIVVTDNIVTDEYGSDPSQCGVEGVKIRGSETILISGDSNPFYYDAIKQKFIEESIPITFVTNVDESLIVFDFYSDRNIEQNVEKTMNLKLNEFYPLGLNDGVLIKDVYPDGCTNSEDYLIKLNFKCGNKPVPEQKEFCSSDSDMEMTFCDSKYKITTALLPKKTDDLVTFPFTFVVTKLGSELVETFRGGLRE